MTKYVKRTFCDAHAVFMHMLTERSHKPLLLGRETIAFKPCWNPDAHIGERNTLSAKPLKNKC